MKRNLFIIIGIFVGTIVIIVLSDVITLGEKIAKVTKCWQAEYVFYSLLLILFAYFVIWPIIRIYRSPQLPELSVENKESDKELFKFGKRLASNSCYIRNPQVRKSHVSELNSNLSQYAGNASYLKVLVENELKIRIEGDKNMNVLGINGRIKEWAKTVFMITAVSQNSKFDTLAVLVLNFKMIEDVILASGFRPSTSQMFNLYVNILATSLVTYCVSSVFDNMDDVEPLDFLDNANIDDISDGAVEEMHDGGFLTNILHGFSKLKIPGFLVGSALDGATNALMTLRLGYVTRHYLIHGIQTSKSQRRQVKREAMLNAVKTLPVIIKDSSAVVGDKVAQTILKTYKAM